MPSTFTFQSFQVNEILNWTHIGPYILHWSSVEKRWIFDVGKDRKKLKRFIRFNAIWKSICAWYIIAAQIVAKFHPNIFKIEHYIMCSVIFQLVVSSLLGDLVLTIYGVEMIGCCNWSYDVENEWNRHYLESVLSQGYRAGRGSSATILTPGKDKTGKLVLILGIWTTLNMPLISLVTVISDWDPIVIYMNVFVETFEVDRRLCEIICLGIIGKSCRFIVLNTLLESSAVGIRAPIIAALTTAVSFVNIEKTLSRVPLSNASFSLYKQMYLERNILWEYEKFAVTVLISTNFFALVMSFNAIQIGLYRMDFAVTFTAGFFAIVTIAILSVFLSMCSAIHEKSLNILLKWKGEAGIKWNNAYIIRAVRSCRPLFVPSGSMGKIDKEMKTNYIDAVSVNTINVMLALKAFL